MQPKIISFILQLRQHLLPYSVATLSLLRLVPTVIFNKKMMLPMLQVQLKFLEEPMLLCKVLQLQMYSSRQPLIQLRQRPSQPYLMLMQTITIKKFNSKTHPILHQIKTVLYTLMTDQSPTLLPLKVYMFNITMYLLL